MLIVLLEMKKLLVLLIALAISSICQAENVEVYLCESRSGDIHWGEKGDEDNTTFLTFYRLGKKVSALKVDDFPSLFKKAKEYDQSSEPFFGPGFAYILKDTKGNYYIAYFEYEEGHKTFNGFRVAIGPLRTIGNQPNIFEGSPHSMGSATSFDKDLLAQLKAITKNTAEQDTSSKH